MAESDFRAKIVALAPSAEALAAIGAALQLQRDGATVPAEMQGLLDTRSSSFAFQCRAISTPRKSTASWRS